MKKGKIIQIFLLLLTLGCILTLTSCKKNDKVVVEKFPEMVNKMKSYKLEGKLESFFPTGSKECEVTVYYKQPELYRVEVSAPNTNESQIMIKNGDGVFVLVPGINKTFKINSKWPTYSSYPYLLQSLSKDMISDQDMITTNNGDTSTMELKAKIYHNAQNTRQKITFNNKTKLPTEVLVYDEEGNTISNFKISKIEVDKEIDNKIFVINDSMETARLIYQDDAPVFDRVVTYPTYCVAGSTFKDEVITGNAQNKQVIMRYAGEQNFTIIEKYITPSETTKTEYADGDIYIMGGTIAIVNSTSVKFYENGIEYVLASNEVSIVNLIKMAESLRTVDMK